MSEYGLKAARAIHQDLDSSAAWLAADLRNAITPLAIVYGELQRETNAGQHQTSRSEQARDVKDCIDHIMLLAAALDGKQ